MATLAEESPDYAEKVRAYLERHGARRLPWGGIVAHGALTMTTGSRERQEHAEIAEAALALVRGLGVTDEQLRTMVEALPWNATPEDYRAKLVELRSAP